MSEKSAAPSPEIDTAAIMGGLYGDGIIACKGAFQTLSRPSGAATLRAG